MVCVVLGMYLRLYNTRLWFYVSQCGSNADNPIEINNLQSDRSCVTSENDAFRVSQKADHLSQMCQKSASLASVTLKNTQTRNHSACHVSPSHKLYACTEIPIYGKFCTEYRHTQAHCLSCFTRKRSDRASRTLVPPDFRQNKTRTRRVFP